MTTASEAGKSPGRGRCWFESLVLGAGIPLAIWCASRLISFSFAAAVDGSPEERFFYWLIAGVATEWLFVAGLWFALRRRGERFKDLGIWRLGTWPAWLLALSLAALSIASNLRLFPRMHLPIAAAFSPHGFHLFAALLLGITAGFCEEVLFRGYLMTQFSSAGYGKAIQVLGPGAAFGLSHAGYLTQGWMVWLGIMVPTAILGMLWGVAYLLGRRSLLPSMVAHFLNDATALHWIAFFMVTSR